MEPGEHPGGNVFVAADVHYLAFGGARAAAVIAGDAAFSRLAADHIALVPDAEPYQPGRFYLRELPPLRAVLDGLDQMALLIIDGYADLDPGGRPGLGVRARDELGVPVIGVAKSAFRTATHAIPVLRGTSARPLYVTAAGMLRADAADLVRHMAGQHRLPDALHRVDSLAHHGLPQPPRRSPIRTHSSAHRGRSSVASVASVQERSASEAVMPHRQDLSGRTIAPAAPPHGQHLVRYIAGDLSLCETRASCRCARI